MQGLHEKLSRITSDFFSDALIEVGWIENKDHQMVSSIHYMCGVFFSNLIKSIPMIIIALLLGTVQEVLIFVATYASIRVFSYGSHFENSWFCFVQGILYYTTSPFIAKLFVADLQIAIAIMVLCAILLAIYAPAKSKHTYVKKKGKVTLLKIASVLVVLFHVYNMNRYYQAANYITANIILIATVLQTINVLPFVINIVEKSNKDVKETGGKEHE